ncbi:MAG: hypothetical protein ACXIT9_13400 [Nitritalea sp.]
MKKEPMYDFGYLREITDHDQELMQQVVDEFLLLCEESTHAFSHASSAQDPAMLYTFAHKIKPNLVMLGVPKSLVQEVVYLEASGKGATWTEELQTRIEQVVSLLHVLRRELAAATL